MCILSNHIILGASYLFKVSSLIIIVLLCVFSWSHACFLVLLLVVVGCLWICGRMIVAHACSLYDTTTTTTITITSTTVVKDEKKEDHNIMQINKTTSAAMQSRSYY
jgi:predicted RND superfamily exporter protein